MKQYGAEFLGTFWLVLGGCGSAVLAATFPEVGIGLLGVPIAFGLTVLTMAYAIGHVSGCHFNPAVSIGLWAGGRFPAGQLLPYIVAQLLGGIVAGGALYTSSPAARPASTWPRDSPPTATARTRRAATRCWPRWCARW
jgi:aquaporin Z